MPEFTSLSPSLFETISSVALALAITHTFFIKKLRQLGEQLSDQGSKWGSLFHLLGEVEFVFGFWAAACLSVFIFRDSVKAASYVASRDFTEAFFVFVIMAVSASRPIMDLAESIIHRLARILPFPPAMSFILATIAIGPLTGSLITEPAAMTVISLVVLEKLFARPISIKLKYALLALLFVNISIGGTLTPFAAPPVLMVASLWGWNLKFMLLNFGWRAVTASLLSSVWVIWRYRVELSSLSWDTISSPRDVTSAFDRVLSVLLLANVVRSAHAPKSLLVSFGVLVALSFLSGRLRTIADLKKLRFHQALMVGVFLASLVFFGGHQRWWLEPIITRLSALPLFVSAIALTGIIDNAAITFLGAQVPTLTAAQKYLLVAGSVVGGGLTVIANAPNPVGYEILGPEFGKNGISPSHLLRAALVPTLISAVIFWI